MFAVFAGYSAKHILTLLKIKVLFTAGKISWPFQNLLHTNRKAQNPYQRILGFWSKWRDSNSRHPAPKKLWELFSNIFRSYLAPFIPEMLLFETLVSTVSMCSKIEYGQKCGQIQLLPGSHLNRGAFLLLRCGDCSFENENCQVIFAFRIEWL